MPALSNPDYFVAIALFILAIAARWPLIASGETLLHSDEAIVGLMAQDIAAGERFPIYFYGQRYMGALEAYVIAAISPLFDSPIVALRMGPALFFAGLVAVQYLMLKRWFGRRGGLIGAATLLAGSPMFAQWSISARGAYIEILLWGSLLLWAYTEWFAIGAPHPTNRRKFLFGLLLGSGFWLNPSIVLFAAPIVLHLVITKWTHLPREQKPALACRWVDRLGVLTLPSLTLAAILALNCLYAVWVDHGRVHQMLLLNLVPKPAAIALIAAFIGMLFVLVRRSTKQYRVHSIARQRSLSVAGLIAPLILGVLVGAFPAALYAGRTALGLQAMEPSLPLGLRPLWEIGPTLSFLRHGLPFLFGADARPFLELVTIGRPSSLTSLGIIESSVVTAANMIVLGSVLTGAMVFLVAYREQIAGLLRLDLTSNTLIPHSPIALLVLCFAATLGLFLLGGCTHDFNTIRYLIPLWAILPGLIAAVFVASGPHAGRRMQFSFAARIVPLCLLSAWAVGQVAMASQLGKPHPLRPLAEMLAEKKIDHAVAEIFDAHLLSYLTDQRCRVAEFDPFWSRLTNYKRREGPVDYVVRTSPIPEDAAPWRNPGPPPPETSHPLWPRLRDAITENPALCLVREPLVDGYERIRLARPLDERARH
jgi:hypothetical protein